MLYSAWALWMIPSPRLSCLRGVFLANHLASNDNLTRTTKRQNIYQGKLAQEAQLMLTTGSTHLAVSRGQRTWYHSTCYIWFPIVQ